MKSISYTSLIFSVLTLLYVNTVTAQANTTLSNLSSPTAINQDLLPNTTNTRNIGSDTKGWKKIYLTSALVLNSKLTLYSPGTSNFFVGKAAGNTSLTGSYNTGTGLEALFSNTSGSYNNANGYRSLYANTTGTGNTATGSSSLRTNTVGYSNTATGYFALYNNTEGYDNTSHGASALLSNSSGDANTATGSGALYGNTTGSYNTASGNLALYLNNSGSSNVAYGYRSVYFLSTGSYNTGIGTNALYSKTTGIGNTAVGYNAGSFYNNSYNLFLGYGTQSSSSGVNYSAAIGYGATVNASNKIQLGTSTTVLATTGGVTIVSDGRFKDNVQDNDVPGLAFINKLRPVTYNMNYKRFDNFLKKNLKAEKDYMADAVLEARLVEKSSQRETGFIAQEVESLCIEKGYVFNGLYTPQNENDNYALDYSRFVVPLVKSVQELSLQNEELKKQNDLLQLQQAEIIKQLADLKALVAISPIDRSQHITGATLEQNVPNPANGKTVISYRLPVQYVTAQIIFYDVAGKAIKQIKLSGHGTGTASINASALAAGAYSYSLLLDGKLVATKKMLLSK